MKKSASALPVLLFLSFVLFALPEPHIAEAETKTIVVPDDYPTIQGAIGNASDCDTIYVKKGIYDGPINQTLVINKTLSLMGENPETTILNLHPAWVVQSWDFTMTPVYGYEHSVEIQASDVELSGFTFKGPGNFYVAGYNTQISNNVITVYLWLVGSKDNASHNNIRSITVGGSGNTVSKNTFTGGIDVRFGSLHTICDNLVTNGSCIGLVESSNNKIFNNTVKNCKIGIAIHLISSGNAVYNNILFNNEVGFAIHIDGNNNAIYENYVANSSCGVVVGRHSTSGKNTSVYHNNFVDNIEQIRIEPRANNYDSIFDNGKEGNYWSNYNGTDNDGDGIGDTPFIIAGARQDNYPLMEPVEIEYIPEFPLWLVLPLFLTATLAVTLCRKKLTKNTQPKQSY
jgi:parallel beta-helix repeat protein